MKINKLMNYLNLPHHIANHVVGEHHTQRHRRIAGVVVMFIGVSLAHLAQHYFGNILLVLWGDLVGYSIHATGFIPFIKDIEQSNKPNCETC